MGPAKTTLPLSAEKARIFRITHIENVPWILEHGLHCASSDTIDPNFRSIGNTGLIDLRRSTVVPIPPYGTLGDYVPFYFTSRTPMLYNIKTGRNVPAVPMREIAIIVSSMHHLVEQRIDFVFTNRHAYLRTAQFFSDIEDLDAIDWDILSRSDFARDDNDLDKTDRYQAEALIYRHLPMAAVSGIICYSTQEQDMISRQVASAGHSTPVIAKNAYFV